jgi:hypothetical protein
MTTTRWISVLGLFLFTLSARAQATPPASSMKGWELYSWFDMDCSASPQVHSAPNDDSWCFALVEGTNRVKTDDEIVKQKLPLGGLLTKLTGLEKGEAVFWLSDETFTMPGRALEKKVRRTAARLGLTLTLGKRPK